MKDDDSFFAGGGEGEDDAGDDTNEGKDTDSKPQKFTIDDKEYTLDEIKAGMMRQDDYTRKTQVVSDKERELTEREAALTDSSDDDNSDDDAGKDDTRVKALEKKVEGIEKSSQDDRLSRTLGDLRTGKDGDLFTKHEEAIFKYAEEKGIYNPEHAFSAFKGDNMQLFTEEAIKNAKQEVKDNAVKNAAASSEDEHGGAGVQSGDYKVDPINIKQGKLGAEFKRWQQSKA